ncbi:MAG: AbrB/MazE/SpoVT family DNA-binding domain-containing protein [Candidatus Bathyarchaeia archaeon]|nr:AbrB/MazE/SpoVT family DNA-binding domain-containing protein [Candidatus Bathyarchaeota archaeon]
MGKSKIGTRGQVTIPKEARKKFNLKEGELVLFIEEDGKLVIVKGVLKI